MASVSLAPAAPLDVELLHGSRHVRKHSRHPTAAAQLPSFTFNPGSPDQENEIGKSEHDTESLRTTAPGHMRRPSRPNPLPEFKFNPGADIPMVRTPSPTHPILEEMALNQQRVSKSAKPAPLPAFTFNPGAPSGSTSPTRLENEGDVHKLTGHRRGGSEFVGGKAEGAQLVVTSPVKHDSKPGGPPISGSAFRGHTHRRSQAVSVSDIDTSDLIKQHALAKARAPSNPSTPQDAVFPLPNGSPGQRHTPPGSRSPPASPRRRGSGTGPRPRIVDFSEKVDVIPRPLSMISSETERSNSTIRGHSLSNSIASIASPLHFSPPNAGSIKTSPVSKPPPMRRPNTADAALLLSGAGETNPGTMLIIPKRPLSASESLIMQSSGSPPLKKKHFWSTHGTDSSPTPTPRQERTDPLEDLETTIEPTDSSPLRIKTSPDKIPAHKRRKYHTWTAGIFSKKSKHRAAKKSRRSPTPPALLRKSSDKIDDIFDADDTVVLRENSPVGFRKQASAQQTTRIPPPLAYSSEVTSPVLDLDAALDPFMEDRRYSDDHARGKPSRIAKLHSSERRGVIDAFGVNHRRTESAPALSPVNRSTLFGMRQHGSNASLSEEVFDEQEEDNFLAHEEETKTCPRIEQAQIRIADIPTPHDSGLGLANMPEDADDVLIVDFDADTGVEDTRSSNSTIEAPILSATDMPKRPSTSPMPFAYPNHQLHYASSTEGRTTSASLISSPDADHASFEMQARSRRVGDQIADSLRPSTDDLPSLSDSASSNAIPGISGSGRSRPSLEQRSNSMFVPGSRRLQEPWKRSSLASLSRLIPGSSHGSKVKLDNLSHENDDKSGKKSHRISKLMRFWRSKQTEQRNSLD